MLSDLLPVIGLVAAAVVLPLVGLMALRSRQRYCGPNPRPCFWCGRDCDHYRLEKLPQ